MRRLIDESELIEIIQGNEELLEFQKDECINCIKACDTAYDPDKVVEQLEELGQKMSESKSIQKYGKSSPANHRYYKAVSVKRAIEIVKGGGVNE